MRSNIFDRLAFLSLFLVIVLLPIFFLPFTRIGIEISKGLLLVVGLSLATIFWAIARFFDGKIVLPRSWLIVSGAGIALIFLFSALMSGNPAASMFGIMLDLGSFWYMFGAVMLMVVAALVVKSPKEANITLIGIILASLIFIVFQIAHIFFPSVLSLGVLSGKTANLLGSWNALGIFAGFSALMFLLLLEFFSLSKIGKIFLEVFIVLAILLAAGVNFELVWMLLGISALIIFVYKASDSFQQPEDNNEKRKFPAVAFAVVMICLLFFTSGQFVGNFIPQKLNLPNAEIRPSLIATLSTTKGVIKNDPVLGMGPNRFSEAWAMYKPLSINRTAFWDVSFTSGSGVLPTLAATTGILGVLAIIVFLVLFLWSGSKSVFSSIKTGSNRETMAFFVLSLYLFISLFFYSAGSVIFLLALAFTGVFIGLSTAKEGKEITISFLNDHRKSFFSILALILLIIFAVIVAFKYIEKFASVPYFNQVASAQDMAQAERAINKAITLHSNDLYLGTYSQIYLLKLNSLAQKGTLSEAEKAEMQTSFEQAVNSARLAVAENPSNYQNHILLGKIYQAVGSMGVKDAYQGAVEAYRAASLLNPLNPGIKLLMSNAAFLDGKTKDAREYAEAALALKGDYIDALLMLSQISKKEGNSSLAVSYAEQALALDPTNAQLSQYLNSLKAPAPSSATNETKEE